MTAFFVKLINNGNLVNIIACVVTVMALVFTLYLWLLDKMSDDEAKFVMHKVDILAVLKKSRESIQSIIDSYHAEGPVIEIEVLRKALEAIENASSEMGIVLNYRFWVHSKQNADYKKIKEFYLDSRYLVSTIQRYLEYRDTLDLGNSLLIIQTLSESDIYALLSDYICGLHITIEFIENWK